MAYIKITKQGKEKETCKTKSTILNGINQSERTLENCPKPLMTESLTIKSIIRRTLTKQKRANLQSNRNGIKE